MVHALREAWRALAAGGILLDLRPLALSGPVEVVRESGAVVVGSVEPSAGAFADDAASDRAIASVLADGFFSELGRTDFEFAYYFDSADELRSHIETRGARRQKIPSRADLRRARRELAARPGGSLRWTLDVMLCAYRRLEPSPSKPA
jgi:hypothetical protein